jgi:hypothetical protein
MSTASETRALDYFIIRTCFSFVALLVFHCRLEWSGIGRTLVACFGIVTRSHETYQPRRLSQPLQHARSLLVNASATASSSCCCFCRLSHPLTSASAFLNLSTSSLIIARSFNKITCYNLTDKSFAVGQCEYRTEVCWNGLYLVGPVYSRAKKAHANTINPGVLTFHLIAQSFILRQSCCIWSPLSDVNVQASYSGVFQYIRKLLQVLFIVAYSNLLIR